MGAAFLVLQALLADTNLSLYENDQGWVVAIPLAALLNNNKAEDASEPAEPELTRELTQELRWRVGVRSLRLKNVNVNAQYKEDAHHLTLNSATYSRGSPKSRRLF